MEQTDILHLLPSMEAIAEELDVLGWPHRARTSGGGRGFCGVRLFCGQDSLEPDCVYIVRPEHVDAFPADRYAYLTPARLSGQAEHICCSGRSPEELLEAALALFQRYRAWERQLDALVLSGGDLNGLCALGREILGAPVVIHDAWFIILGLSDGLPPAMLPESVAESSKSYIPRRFLDSFRNDPDYLQTRSVRGAALWEDKGGAGRCIYANLWDGCEYLGRLLVLETSRPLGPRQFRAAECLAQRAVMILDRGRAAGRWGYHNLDDIVYALLTGRPSETMDTAILLNALGWQRSDRYQCIRLQGGPDTAAVEQVAHSDLFQLFGNSYIMFIQRQQCVVLDQTRTPVPPEQIRQRLETFCRDYRFRAGVSSPVWGIDALCHAFRQADIALESAFQGTCPVAMFSACALDYILRSVRTDLPSGHLAAPELLELLDQDRKRGTEYYATLRAFLVNERDVTRASEALIIHRTTLLYRLKKIHAITGLDLEDPDLRLYLLLSFRLLAQIPPTQARQEKQAPSK